MSVLQSLTRRGTTFCFIQASTLDIEIDETDLLFIDTQHTYAQLIAELRKHHSKVRRWIALHDTMIFGEVGDLGDAAYDRLWKTFWLSAPIGKSSMMFHLTMD